MKKENAKKLDMTTGSVTGKLLLFTLPILATNLLQHLYNAADKAVVGNFAADGSGALAAIGATTSAITLLLNSFIGLALGANVICANLRGAGETASLRKAMHSSILLAALVGIFVGGFGQLITEPFLTLMGCPKEVMDAALLYMRLYLLGAPFSLLYNFGAAILRSSGDTRRPMVILGISGLVNVGLNMIFVICFGMSADGVALATVISQLLSAVVVLWILFKSDGGYDLNLRELKFHKKELAAITRVGIPSGINNALFSIANVTVQSSINSLGPDAMAGASTSTAISGLVIQVVNAFGNANVSFTGQCFGAKKYDRIHKLLRTSLALCLSVMACLTVTITLTPRTFQLIFTDNENAIRAGTPQLIIMCWSYLIYSFSDLTLGVLRGMKYSTVPTLLNVVCICLPRLIWIFFFFPMLRELWFLYLCYPISYIISSIAQVTFYLCVRKNIRIQAKEG